ncbi:hypothetical protein C8Q74DRAFT_733211 [Fomes fomentarius]|nr:hypothetical protein C8Q74DRAFT_733211 [Fomes fomentarius]
MEDRDSHCAKYVSHSMSADSAHTPLRNSHSHGCWCSVPYGITSTLRIVLQLHEAAASENCVRPEPCCAAHSHSKLKTRHCKAPSKLYPDAPIPIALATPTLPKICMTALSSSRSGSPLNPPPRNLDGAAHNKRDNWTLVLVQHEAFRRHNCGLFSLTAYVQPPLYAWPSHRSRSGRIRARAQTSYTDSTDWMEWMEDEGRRRQRTHALCPTQRTIDLPPVQIRSTMGGRS